MPTYAILGGTGATGGALIKQLAQAPDTNLHVYARSESKLLAAHPILAQAGTPHAIFTGELSDVAVMEKTLHNVDAVFAVVGTNSNRPGLHIAQDSAQSIIAALTNLHDRSPSPKDYRPPTVVFITSAGMASDKRVHANFPNWLHNMIQTVGKNIYADFRVATGMFRRPANLWIPTIFYCSPGIMPGPSGGPVRVGVDIPKKAPIYVTYTDLARGMVIAASEVEQWRNVEIGVIGSKMPKIHYGEMFGIFIVNTLAVAAPSLWWFGYNRQWWS